MSLCELSFMDWRSSRVPWPRKVPEQVFIRFGPDYARKAIAKAEGEVTHV